jgi:hypothetical protein
MDCHVSRVCDYKWGMDWILDLLTTYTHHLELHVITALLLIFTLHSSLQHHLSLPQPAVSSTSRSLATASNSEDSSASRAQVLLSELLSIPSIPTDNYQLRNSQSNSLLQLPTISSLFSNYLSWPGVLVNNLGPDPTGNTAFNSFYIGVGMFTYPLHRNGRLLIRLLHSNGCTFYSMFYTACMRFVQIRGPLIFTIKINSYSTW